MSDILVRDAQINDAEQISSIYAYYVENDICTFEEISPSVSQVEQRISAIAQSSKSTKFLFIEKPSIEPYYLLI